MRDARKEWNSIAAEYDTKIVRGDFFREKILNASLLRHLDKIQNKFVLDLGCGQGYLSEILASHGATVTGIDISDTLIAFARERYKHTHISFVVGDIEQQLPFENNTFDIVVANMVLMDIEHPEHALQEAVRVTKNKGVILSSILHPLFTGGAIHKPLIDLLLRKPPSFLIKKYKTPMPLKWEMKETTHTTTLFHRPLEYYVNLFAKQTIHIVSMEELTLPKEYCENGFQKTLHEIPMFVLLKGIINK